MQLYVWLLKPHKREKVQTSGAAESRSQSRARASLLLTTTESWDLSLPKLKLVYTNFKRDRKEIVHTH